LILFEVQQRAHASADVLDNVGVREGDAHSDLRKRVRSVADVGQEDLQHGTPLRVVAWRLLGEDRLRERDQRIQSRVVDAVPWPLRNPLDRGPVAGDEAWEDDVRRDVGADALFHSAGSNVGVRWIGQSGHEA